MKPLFTRLSLLLALPAMLLMNALPTDFLAKSGHLSLASSDPYSAPAPSPDKNVRPAFLAEAAPLTTGMNLSRSEPNSGYYFHPPMSLPDICETKNQVFKPGEKIVYKLYYNWNFVWLAAGEVTFLVHELPDYYHIMVRGRTYESYEWFYKVRDNYESYLDKKTLLPHIHIKDVNEGGYTRYDRTSFDQTAGRAISSRGRTRNDLEDKEIALDECMHDLISIVYYARNLDYKNMQKGDKIPLKILMDRDIYPLSLKYLGAEPNLKVRNGGRYNTQKFSPQLIAGEVFKEGDEMKIYVSDDQNRLPIMIESPVSVGSVKAVLQSYEGLRFPMTAKVE
jgi:hypothetical protein